MRMHWVAPFAARIAISSADVVCAQGLDWGKNEYLLSCQPCHGTTGRGDGPAASHLARHPADLTKLSESNGGVFPFVRVFEMIDGRLDVAMHGPREMPVWGDRYKRDVIASTPTGSLTEEAANLLARRRILELIEYISTLQEKPATSP
jgi:hypothetical protein